MIDSNLMSALLDSLIEPIVFADTDHTIIYMNKAAIEKYRSRGGSGLVGRSLLDCHNEQSQKLIRELLAAMKNGEKERLVTDNEKNRAYMRAVRTPNGQLLGYYERYEPPVK